MAVDPTGASKLGDDQRRGGSTGSTGAFRLSNNEVLLPPSVAFNAGLGPLSSHIILRRAHSGVVGDPGTVLHSPPPIARTASVSRVNRPRPTSAGSVGSTAKRAEAHALALLSFFSTPRVLRVGDVFGVSIPRPGGSGGGGGVGCWWQEVRRDESDANGDEAPPSEDGEDTHEEELGDPASGDHPHPLGSVGNSWNVLRETADSVVGPPAAAAAPPREGTNGDVVSTVNAVGRAVEDDATTSGGRQPLPPPARRRRRAATAAQNFRDAIVRQGSELVYFRVTDLEGEDAGSGGGGGGRGGGNSSREAVLGVAWRDGLVGGEGGSGAAAERGMVVSQRATELREGGPVCSAVPDASRYQRFVCGANGYPFPEVKPPLVSMYGRVVVAEFGRLIVAAGLLGGMRFGETDRLVISCFNGMAQGTGRIQTRRRTGRWPGG